MILASRELLIGEREGRIRILKEERSGERREVVVFCSVCCSRSYPIMFAFLFTYPLTSIQSALNKRFFCQRSMYYGS